jgi:hypothetical protein
LLFVILQLLAGCSLLDPQKEPEIADRSFITGDPCEAPCWYDLIPGESPESLAEEVLAELPFVHQNLIRVWENTAFLDFTDGTHIDYTCVEGDENPPCGHIYLADGIVQYIGYNVLYQLPLETIFEKLGKPDYVLYTASSPHGDGCTVMLDWLERGISAEIIHTRKRQTCIDLAEGRAFDADILVTDLIYQSKATQVPDRCGQLPCVPWPGFTDR